MVLEAEPSGCPHGRPLGKAPRQVMVDHQLAFLLDHFPEVAEYSARRTRINAPLHRRAREWVLLLNVFDVARSLGAKPLEATATSVANWLLTEYVPKRGGSFNYNPAINATFDLFRARLLRSKRPVLSEQR